MIKFIIPAVIIFLIVLFWEKISEKLLQKFNIKIGQILIAISLLILSMILILLYF